MNTRTRGFLRRAGNAAGISAIAGAWLTAGLSSGLGAEHAKHWAYEDGPDAVGPAHWGDLPGDGLCALGKRESPIALSDSGTTAAAPAKQPTLAFAYRPSALTMTNNGHTVQVDYAPGSSVSENGVSYSLAQFHFHAPSEHTLDGRRFPLEIHLVHVDASGRPAVVVGLFAEEGAANGALQPIFAALPAHSGEKSAPAGATVSAAGFLPVDRAFFAYDGSLTTPPCTEGIRWRVFRRPIALSRAQIESFRSLPHFAHTNRPEQPIGNRRVTLVGTTP